MQRKKSISVTTLLKASFLLFLFIMFLFPSSALKGAKRGLLLWFNTVLPTLLPFIIISTLIIRLNVTNFICKLLFPIVGRIFRVSENACYPILMGFLSGIPMGAKTSVDLYEARKITKDEAMFLSIMCNNASPMFVIGYIVLSELQVKHIELPMIIILYSSAIISACIFRSYNTRFKYKLAAQKLKLSYSLGTVNAQSLDSSEPELDLNTRRTRFDFSVIDSSIMSGFEVITKVGGYIILFSILTEIILSIPVIPSLLKYLLVGICEITTGINTYACSTLPEQIKIILILSITSFGGLSGLAQTKSVFGESGLSIRTYSKAKLLSMLITCVLTIAYVML